MRKYGPIFLATVVIALAVLEALPQKHINPAVRKEPAWNDAATRTLAKRACFDCHSNETKWPAYASHAPVSWVILSDVEHGRSALNFSEWDRPQVQVPDLVRSIISGKMPPELYLVSHSNARLTLSERTQLANGLQQTVAPSHIH